MLWYGVQSLRFEVIFHSSESFHRLPQSLGVRGGGFPESVAPGWGSHNRSIAYSDRYWSPWKITVNSELLWAVM